MKYFSIFSGIGAFEIAVKQLKLNWQSVGYSEVDKYALQIYQKHFPRHENFGDITKIDIKNLPDFDLLVGGSPCQDLSIAKKNRKGLDGSRSGLFFKFLEILKVKKPKYFLLENVNSMPKESKEKISELIGVEPVMINASLVSAQQRKRLFWCNWKVEQPEDREIYLKDILESGEPLKEKVYCLTASDHKKDFKNNFVKRRQGNFVLKNNTIRIGQLGKGGQGDRIYSVDGKSVCLSANGGGRGAKTGLYLVKGCAKRTREYKGKQLEIRKDKKSNALTTVQTDSMVSIKNYVRKLTPIECERLQCFPDNFTEGISNTRRYQTLGNAFNVEVIKYIIKKLCKKNSP